MRTAFTLTFALSGIFLLAGHADQKARATTVLGTTLKAGTEFVQVPVIVQRSGQHVSGLGKADFSLQQDGKDQPIATFEEVHAVAAVAPKSGAEFENTYSAGQTPPRLTIIAIDAENTAPLDLEYFKKEFTEYVAGTKSAGVPIGVVELTRSGIHVLYDFTLDPKGLLAAVQQEKTVVRKNSNEANPTRDIYNEAMARIESPGPQPPGPATPGKNPAFAGNIDPTDAEHMMAQDMEMFRFQDRTSRVDSLLALQQLAQALKGIPGRKTLLWVGSGIKFLDSTLLTREIIPRNAGEALDQNAYTWKLLNDANVAVYPIDTRRTVNTAFEAINPVNANTPSNVVKEDARQSDREIVATFENIAAETGGKPCVYRTDLHNCIREATEDNRDYYLLGFYVDKSNRKPGWHKINVKLNQKATLRYRQGFFVTQANPEATRSLDLQLALNSPIDYTDLPLRCQFSGFKENGTKKSASFQLAIPPDAISVDEANGRINFDVVAVARAVGGAEAGRISQHIDRKFPPENIAEIKRTGIDYRNKIDLVPGEYGVWFVVRDNPTGRTGSIVVPLKVP